MLPAHRFSINTYDKAALASARSLGMGLEIEEYLWLYDEEEIEIKKKTVSEIMTGFPTLSFHGTAVDRDVCAIDKLPNETLLSIYHASYGYAHFHGVNKIVFHSNYLAAKQPQAQWIKQKAAFWTEFLRDKPPQTQVFIENFIDDTPELLGLLCDRVEDPRFQVCLDIGHAGCNSPLDLSQWINILGKRIGHVHLHNNDGHADRHWPLGRGVLPMAQIMEKLLDAADVSSFVLECSLSDSLPWLYQNGFL